VRGARAGQTLVVHIDEVVPRPWGETWADGEGFVWRLDGAVWRLDDWSVPAAPFLGVIGMPPPEPGEHSTIPPRRWGGNIDCKELVAGTQLWLPVPVEGALVMAGDGHGAQGDGEVSGTAIECGMTTELTFELLPERPVASIHAETPAGRITFGFSADLNEAMAAALGAMVDWMMDLYSLDRTAALALASPTVDLRITQVANGTWGVHAVLPPDVIR
jgi:acetamidase/formamidase